MSTLVVGDVHGCARELADMLDRHPADDVVLVGDLYTKGPDPEGVWELIRDRGLLTVLGNHDHRLLRVLDGERRKDTHAHEVVRRLDRTGAAWRDHLRDTPLHRAVDGWTVVHAGLRPSGDLADTPADELLTLRRYPHRSDGPFWWQAYRGERRVVYGHDAVRGLVIVRRSGRLHTVGLDTGCVYGGRLSGLSLGDERIVAVAAERVWYAPEVD